MERPCSRVIVVPNLLKSSTNSPVISSLSVAFAEKLRLVLTTDVVRTQSIRKAFRAAREPDRVKTFSSACRVEKLWGGRRRLWQPSSDGYRIGHASQTHCA